MNDETQRRFSTAAPRRMRVKPLAELPDRAFTYTGGMSGEEFEAGFQAELAALRAKKEGSNS